MTFAYALKFWPYSLQVLSTKVESSITASSHVGVQSGALDGVVVLVVLVVVLLVVLLVVLVVVGVVLVEGDVVTVVVQGAGVSIHEHNCTLINDVLDWADIDMR